MEIDPGWHVTRLWPFQLDLNGDDFSVPRMARFLLHHFRLPVLTTSTA